MNIIKNTLYERFHKSTRTQKYIISEKNFTYRKILSVINKFISPNSNILDIGCGAGTISFYLASKGNNITGIDISKSAIAACKQSALQLGISKLTTFKIMEFPKETPNDHYDLVLCFEVIEHLNNDDLALKRIYKLLKKGGIAIISTPSANAPLHRLGLAKDFDKRVGHLRRYTLEELIKMCERNNFTIIKSEKTEGVLRNFLFLNPYAGKFVRFIKYFLADAITFFDEVSRRLFGESDLFVVIRKP